jgi:hypothetical protein
MTARGRWRSPGEIKPLTGDRKVLVQRYMIDAEEAQAQRQAAEEAERRAAEELAVRQAAEEAERRAAELALQAAEEAAQRESAKMPEALPAAVERTVLQARADEGRALEPPGTAQGGLEQQPPPAAGQLPIHGWVHVAAQSRDRPAGFDWPRELVRLKEEAQRRE